MDITRSLRILTARTIACRFYLENERYDMERLNEKLKKASGVVLRQTAKIEARADAIIAREQTIEKRTEAVFLPHEQILDSAERGLEDLGRSLALVSNDPLGVSNASQADYPIQPGGSAASNEPSQISDAASSYFQEKPHG